MARKTIYQRIALEGSDEIKRDLQEMGEAGEQAFRDLQKAANPTQGFGNSLIVSLQKIQAELRKVGESFRRAGQQITNVGRTLSMRISAPILAAGGAVTAAITGMASDVRELQNAARISNVSFEDFQRLAFAAETVGIESSKLADIYKDVNDRIGDFLQTGGGPMADFFEKIAPQVGVTAEMFRNLSGPDALQLFFNTLQRAGLSQQEMTFFLEAMASDLTALIPLLRDGGRAMDDLWGRATVISDQEAAQLENYTEAIRDMREALRDLTLAFANSGIIEYLTDIIERATEWVSAVAKANPELFRWGVVIAGVAAAIGPLVIGLGLLVSSIGWIIGGFAAFFGTLSGLGVLLANVTGAVAAMFAGWAGGAKVALGVLSAILGWPALIGAAIGLAAAAIYVFWDDIVAAAERAWEYVKDLWPGLAETLEAVWATIAAGATAAWEGIKAGISEAWEFIKSIFTSSPGEVWQTILTAADSVWEGLKAGGRGAWEAIKTGFSAIPGAIGWVWDALGSAAAGAWGFLGNQFSGAFDGIVAAASSAWDSLSGIWSNIREAAAETWETVRAGAGDIWSGVSSSFNEMAGGVSGLLEQLATSIQSRWGSIVSESERMSIDAISPWRRAEGQIVSIWQRIIRAIQNQFQSLERSIASLVTRLVAQINRLLAAAARARAAASGGGGGGGSEPAFASGGYVRGPGSGTSDSILARLSNGEFVIRSAAVKHYGPQLLAALNSMRLPKNFPGFNMGGLVDGFRQSMASLGGAGSLPRFATGGMAIAGPNTSPGKSFDLHIDGQVFRGLMAPDDVAQAMQTFAGTRGRASAGRKPGWFK